MTTLNSGDDVEEDSIVNFTCSPGPTSAGTPAGTVYTLMKGNKVVKDYSEQGGDLSDFVVTPFQTPDAGSYSCAVKEDAGNIGESERSDPIDLNYKAFLRVMYSEDLKKEIVARHNDLRATECAVDMPVMQWSEALAEMGGRVADRCHAGHSGEGIPGTEGWGNNKTFHGFAYAGENAHWSGNIDPTKTDAGFVGSFGINEKPYYNILTDKCEAGKVCGHYTQVVAAVSTHVGCGSTVCYKTTTKEEVLTNIQGQKTYCLYGEGHGGGVPYKLDVWGKTRKCGYISSDIGLAAKVVIGMVVGLFAASSVTLSLFIYYRKSQVAPLMTETVETPANFTPAQT